MKLLILDNFDSFTYNLVQIVREIVTTASDIQLDIKRNNQISIEDCHVYDSFILSPGPGIPDEAGIMKGLIAYYAAEKQMLGVCLGHQAIAEVCGARLQNLDHVVHGKATPIHQTSDHIIFQDLPRVFHAARYHSWVVDPSSLPETLVVTATDDAGVIMALRHRDYPLHGVQFHPESILTPHGSQIIRNFLLNQSNIN